MIETILKFIKYFYLKVLDNFFISVYNTKCRKFNLCIESNPIETYESCQVRKEAAISSKSLCGVFSIEGLNFYIVGGTKTSYINTLYIIKDVRIWGTQLFIENLDQ